MAEEAGTDRLAVLDGGAARLRGFSPDDLAFVAEAAADPVIPLVSSVPTPYSEAAGRRFVERQRRRLGDGYGYSYVITEAASGEPAGAAGLWIRDLDQGRASVGYWILERYRRRGLAAAALGARSRYALVDLEVPRVELFVEPHNAASIATAEHCGFVREGLLRRYQAVGATRRDMLVYSRLADDPDPPELAGGA